MISLFRKIRQKLLADLPASKAGNRVTRYLVYALGEIFLVVIGILIALSINNWNEQRKQTKARQLFTESMLSELKKDSTFLVDIINELEESIAMLQDLKNRINNPLASLDTIDHILKYEYNPGFVKAVDLNKNTFSTLSTSSQIALFKNTEADHIQTYYQLVLNMENFQEGQLNFYRDTFSKFLEKVPSADNMEAYPLLEPGKLKDQIWAGVDMQAARLQFGGITTLQNHIFITFLRMDKELLEANQKLTLHLKGNFP
jgi:hypothetical protein